MSPPSWLDRVLAQHSHLDLTHVDARRELAEQILRSMPIDRLVDAASETATTQLESRNVRDGAGLFGRAMGRNIVQTLLGVLEGE